MDSIVLISPFITSAFPSLLKGASVSKAIGVMQFLFGIYGQVKYHVLVKRESSVQPNTSEHLLRFNKN